MNTNCFDPDPYDDDPRAPWYDDERDCQYGYLEEADYYEEHNGDD